MAIGFRSLTQAGSGGATDPTSATTLPASTATGDLVVALCAVKYASTTITPPSGWQVVANSEAFNTTLTDSGNDAGNIRLALFFREKDAGWSTIPGYDLSGVPNITMIGAITYTKGAGEAWGTPVCANAIDNSTGVTTGIDPAASGTTISFAAGDWFGSVAIINGDAGTLGTHTATVAGVTFGTQVTRMDATTTGGTDMRVHSVDKPYTSGTASAGPDGALSLTAGATTAAGVMVFYKLSLGPPTKTGTLVGAASASGVAVGVPTTFGTAVGAAVASGVVAGTVVPAVHGVAAGAATATGTISAWGNAPGPFHVDFSLYADGPVPEQETGLRDSFKDIPASQDEMGIRSGKLAVVDFRGPDQDFNVGGGRRGLLWRNTSTMFTDVSAKIEPGVDPGGAWAGWKLGAGPTLHINENSPWLGIGTWFLPAPYNWSELGVIGKEQEDFSYIDLTNGTNPPGDLDTVYLRSVGGNIAIIRNGQTVVGPAAIPSDLLFVPVHGIQMDVADDIHEGVGWTSRLDVVTDATALPARTRPTIGATGTAVEVASQTTIAVPYPTGITAGQALWCVVGVRNGGTTTAPGFTEVPTGFTAISSVGVRVLTKIATGSESGSLTVTKSTAGVMAGVMFRTPAVSNSVLGGVATNTAGTSMAAPAVKLFGPKRTAIWIGFTAADSNITLPAGFTSASAGLTGGQAVRLAVGHTDVDTHADNPGPPFNAYATSHWPAQTGSSVTSAAHAEGMLFLQPAYGGTPTMSGWLAGAAVASGTATGTVTAGATVRFGTLVGAATASGVAIGTPRKIGVLVGAATSSGVAIGVPKTFGTAVGAATASGVMIGTPRHPGVLVGAATASGVVVGTPKKLGTAAGPATSTGVATGIVIAEVGFGVLVGAASASGVAIGTPIKVGTASGPATSTGTATGGSVFQVVNGTLVGAAVGSGVIVGKRTTKGVLVGGATASGVVIGAPRRPGLLVGAASASGVVVGKVTHKGILVGAAVASGVVLGAPKKLGTAAGAATTTGAVAVASVIHPGILAGTATAGGTVVGARRVFGTAVGGGVGGGTGTGAGVAEIITGTLVGAAVASGVVVGKVTHKGILVGASSAAGVVVGKVTRKGVLQGAGTGSGVVVATVTHPGSATSAGVGSSTVTGLRSTTGIAVGPATSGSAAIGSTLGSAVGLGQGQASASGVAAGSVGHANTRYARPGGGNWSSNATWSRTSGGPADTTAPTASVEVVIDNLSGNVNADTATCVARSLDCNGYTGTLLINASSSINLGDATPPTGGRILRLGSGMTWTNNGFGLGFNNTTGAGVCTVTSNGKQMGATSILMNSIGSTISLTDTLNIGIGNFTFNSGTFLTNNNTCIWGAFSSSSGSTRVLTLGASTITCIGGNCLTINNNTGLTITANTAIFSTTQAVNPTYAGLPGVNMNGASISATNSSGNPGVLTLPYNWTWRNLTYTTSATQGTTSQITVNDTITFTGTVMITGYSASEKRVLVASSTVGAPRVFSAASVALANTDFRDITAAGVGIPWSGASLGDALGNTNIVFAPPVTRYAVAAGNWSNPAMWSASSGGAGGASVPLPQDNAILDANSGAGTYNVDVLRMCADLYCWGFTRTLTCTINTDVYGSITYPPGGTVTGSDPIIFLCGRGSHTIVSNGKTTNWRLDFLSGTYALSDAYVCSAGGGTLRCYTPGVIFSDNGQSVTLTGTGGGFFQSVGTYTLTGTWTIPAGGTWTHTGGTLNASGATIIYATGTAARTFEGGGKSYGTLTYQAAGSTGALTITGANTFGTINFSDATGTRTLNLPATTPIVITQAFNVNGRAGALIGLTGDVSKASGNVGVSYLNISGSDATGGAGFYAGRTSTNGGTNTGWQFVDLVSGVAVAPATSGSTVNGIRIPVTVGIASGPATSGATATGVVVHVITGTAVGAASASGVVVGRRTVKGIAAGPAVGGGTASGLGVAEIINGTAVGSATATGVATGGRRLLGTAVSAGTSGGTSTGVVIHPGICVGAGTSSAVASGLLARVGVAEGSATGGSVVVGTRRTYSGFCLGPATSGSVVNGGVMAARPVAYALHRILRASRE